MTFDEFEKLCNVFNEVLADYPDIVARDIGDYFTMIARGER